MPRSRGSKDPSTRRKRTLLTRAEEIDWLIRYHRGRDGRVTATEAAEALNKRRMATARAEALGAGASPEEAEAAAAAARLSEPTVRRDLRVVADFLQANALVGTALTLDDQVAECQAAIGRLVELSEMAFDDLRRSRTRHWTRTRGVASAEGEKAKPAEMVVHHEDGAAEATLYMVIIRNEEAQLKLRAELRALQFGRQWFPERESSGSFVEALLQTGDPAKAREAALALYQREIASASRDEAATPTGPGREAIALERLRLAGQAARIRQLGDFLDRTAPAAGEAKGGMELVVTRRTARREAP